MKYLYVFSFIILYRFHTFGYSKYTIWASKRVKKYKVSQTCNWAYYITLSKKHITQLSKYKKKTLKPNRSNITLSLMTYWQHCHCQMPCHHGHYSVWASIFVSLPILPPSQHWTCPPPTSSGVALCHSSLWGEYTDSSTDIEQLAIFYVNRINHCSIFFSVNYKNWRVNTNNSKTFNTIKSIKESFESFKQMFSFFMLCTITRGDIMQLSV